MKADHMAVKRSTYAHMGEIRNAYRISVKTWREGSTLETEAQVEGWY
jgi:hypothetical protein